jgi:hypothetical protein
MRTKRYTYRDNPSDYADCPLILSQIACSCLMKLDDYDSFSGDKEYSVIGRKLTACLMTCEDVVAQTINHICHYPLLDNKFAIHILETRLYKIWTFGDRLRDNCLLAIDTLTNQIRIDDEIGA